MQISNLITLFSIFIALAAAAPTPGTGTSKDVVIDHDGTDSSADEQENPLGALQPKKSTAQPQEGDAVALQGTVPDKLATASHPESYRDKQYHGVFHEVVKRAPNSEETSQDTSYGDKYQVTEEGKEGTIEILFTEQNAAHFVPGIKEKIPEFGELENVDPPTFPSKGEEVDRHFTHRIITKPLPNAHANKIMLQLEKEFKIECGRGMIQYVNEGEDQTTGGKKWKGKGKAPGQGVPSSSSTGGNL